MTDKENPAPIILQEIGGQPFTVFQTNELTATVTTGAALAPIPKADPMAGQVAAERDPFITTPYAAALESACRDQCRAAGLYPDEIYQDRAHGMANRRLWTVFAADLLPVVAGYEIARHPQNFVEERFGPTLTREARNHARSRSL